MKESTVFYVVGGEQTHYNNLQRSIKSIRNYYNPKQLHIKVFELGNTLSSNGNYEVETLDANELRGKTKIGYIFWKTKYLAATRIDTEYGMYVDTDTVLVNPVLEEVFSSVGHKIGATQHFWVPTFADYKSKAIPRDRDSIELYSEVVEQLHISPEDKFYAGGCFAFGNTPKNVDVLSEIYMKYAGFYSWKPNYVRGITDEIFFSAIAKDRLVDLHGSLNHCCMGDEFMPLIYSNEVLRGKNPWETEHEPVVFFHCDASRRDPSEKYSGELKKRVQECFYMIEQ